MPLVPPKSSWKCEQGSQPPFVLPAQWQQRASQRPPSSELRAGETHSPHTDLRCLWLIALQTKMFLWNTFGSSSVKTTRLPCFPSAQKHCRRCRQLNICPFKNIFHCEKIQLYSAGMPPPPRVVLIKSYKDYDTSCFCHITKIQSCAFCLPRKSISGWSSQDPGLLNRATDAVCCDQLVVCSW